MCTNSYTGLPMALQFARNHVHLAPRVNNGKSLHEKVWGILKKTLIVPFLLLNPQTSQNRGPQSLSKGGGLPSLFHLLLMPPICSNSQLLHYLPASSFLSKFLSFRTATLYVAEHVSAYSPSANSKPLFYSFLFLSSLCPFIFLSSVCILEYNCKED